MGECGSVGVGEWVSGGVMEWRSEGVGEGVKLEFEFENGFSCSW